MEIREEFTLFERLCYCLATAAKIARENNEMIDTMLLMMFSDAEIEEMTKNSAKINGFIEDYVGGNHEEA